MAQRPALLVTRRLPDKVIARAQRDYDARVNWEDEPYPPADLPPLAEGADGLLVCPTDRCTAAVVGQLPGSVRIIATFSVGHEHIDLGAARRRGIVVTNTPEVLTDSTADVALLLLLGAARRAYEGELLLRSGRWKSWAPTFMLGADVTGRRLGILGMGRIGRALARRARALDMEIHYSSRRRLPSELELGAVFHADPDAMLPLVDFLSLHAPSTPETFHWLDERRIGLMKPGAILVNTARGDLVDDTALIGALRAGRLRAAGLDVYEGEPRIDPGYLTLDNAFLLPHLGSATEGTRDAMGFRALDNLDDFFAGREPRDRVA